MNVYVLTVFVVFGSVAATSKHYNPCKNRSHGDHKRFFEDPQDCSMYYECDTGQRVHHGKCSHGTSFDPNWNNGYGNCVGPDPSTIADCYSDDDDDDDIDHKGTLGPWSEWSTCSVTCGYDGYQKRTRECLGQYSCVGHKEEIQTCDFIPCKGKI